VLLLLVVLLLRLRLGLAAATALDRRLLPLLWLPAAAAAAAGVCHTTLRVAASPHESWPAAAAAGAAGSWQTAIDVLLLLLLLPELLHAVAADVPATHLTVRNQAHNTACTPAGAHTQ
jgi:hypothetical protein